MMDLQEKPFLMTSSDYEHLMEDLRSDNHFQQCNLSPLHINQNPASVPSDRELMDPLQTHDMHPPPLQRYGDVQETGNLELVESTTPVKMAIPSFSPTCTIPCRDDYPGPFNFEIFLDGSTAHKRSWVYSHKLHKVFIDMNKSLLVQFRIKDFVCGLFVRALPVYSMSDYVSVPVQRCALHELADDVLRQAHSKDPVACYCEKFALVRHVVRSSHSQAQYDYDVESDRHSVVVPLDAPQAGSDISTVQYQFSCKTSCTQGMSRKPIDVVFTLETDQCIVVGRQILAVKICSCPKRDKEKEETDALMNKDNISTPGKRRMSALEKEELSKKVKMETNTQGNNEVQGDTNTDTNKKLLEMLEAQQAQISELRTELQQQRTENQQQRAEIQQLRAENNLQMTNIENKLEALYQLLR